MLNDIVLNSIIVTIETLSYRKSIADKLISSSHGHQMVPKREVIMDPTLIKNSRAIYVSLQLSGSVLRCAYMCLSWSDFIKIDLFLLTCSFKLRDFKRFYICKNSQKCVLNALKLVLKFVLNSQFAFLKFAKYAF